MAVVSQIERMAWDDGGDRHPAAKDLLFLCYNLLMLLLPKHAKLKPFLPVNPEHHRRPPSSLASDRAKIDGRAHHPAGRPQQQACHHDMLAPHHHRTRKERFPSARPGRWCLAFQGLAGRLDDPWNWNTEIMETFDVQS